MSNQVWTSIIDRKPVLHRHDCDTFDTHLAESAVPLASHAASLASDEVVRYGLAVRSSYEVLKRVVGQLSGFLILIYGSRRADALDIQSVAAACEQFIEGRDALQAVQPPAAAQDHHAALLQVARLLEGGFDLLGHKDFSRSDDKRLELSRRLNAAHRMILFASDDRFAMTMVDFSQACCSCGVARPRTAMAQPENTRRKP